MPPGFRERATLKASRFVGLSDFPPNFLDGFYQGYGTLAVGNRQCSPREATYITLRQGRAFFEGVSTGTLAGVTGFGEEVRMLSVTRGSTRLVGTFGDAIFIGSLSRSHCVYDYTLRRVAEIETASKPDRAAPHGDPLGKRAPAGQAPPPPAQAGRLEHVAFRAPAGPLLDRAAFAREQARLGNQYLSQGRVSDARKAFERAALNGNAEGALGLGMVYDPIVLSRIKGSHPEADALVARIWYLRAQLLGNTTAERQLARLDAPARP